MSALTADSVVIVRAEYVVDKYGNPSSVRDWANATRTTVPHVSVQPYTQNEEVGDRTATITQWQLYTRTNVDLLATDRVEYMGMTLEVDGEIGRWRFAGRTHHVEVRLRRVAG